jgi:predicted phage baseplate assembly protein
VPESLGEPEQQWRWRRRLLEAPPYENAFTVDPVGFIDVGAAADGAIGQPLWEYDTDAADSIRFGDEVFGQRPALRSEFDVTYRVTNGAAGNVGADTITGVDPTAAGVLRSTNPFPAAGGADEEPLDEVRRRAPYAFRAVKLRAVRIEDYDEVAEQLPWVLDAGTSFRWTGSWLTVFTTAQPRGVEVAPVAEQVGLIDLLNRRRLAGYEVYTPTPHYIGLDLIVTVCALPGALRGEVEAALLAELGTGTRRDGQPAFFAPDQFRFGTPLERSELEIAAQGANGVDGVLRITYRRRGQIPDFVAMPETVSVAADEIIRVDNDPSEPERGSLRIVVKGGK